MPRFLPSFLFASALAFVFCSSLQAETPTKESAPAVLSDMQFVAELNALVAKSPADVGVAICDLTTGQEFSINGDQRFSQAGLSKIHVLAALFRESAAGRIDLTALHQLSVEEKLPGGILHRLGDGSVTMSLRDYATLMVTMDDNSATNIILSKIGADAVNDTLTALGASDIHFAGLLTDPKKPDDNLASPKAVVHCLAELHRSNVLSGSSKAEFFALLSTPRLSAVRTALPRNVRVASKSGIRGNVRCTAAVVFLKNRPYAIAIMTQFRNRTEAELAVDASTTISSLSRLSHAYFSQLPAVAATTEPKRLLSGDRF
jgi:beta-lactamase class A